MRTSDQGGRFQADGGYRALIAGLARAHPQTLGHLRPERILVIAGAARGEARASVRPLTFGGTPPRHRLGRFDKPKIVLGGTPMLYEICLRPLYFLDTAAPQRLRVFIHELWHIGVAFDGSLEPSRRHRAVDAQPFEREVELLASAYQPSAEARQVLEHDGELEISAWLRRPPSRVPLGRLERSYQDDDLYGAIVRQSDRSSRG